MTRYMRTIVIIPIIKIHTTFLYPHLSPSLTPLSPKKRTGGGGEGGRGSQMPRFLHDMWRTVRGGGWMGGKEGAKGRGAM